MYEKYVKEFLIIDKNDFEKETELLETIKTVERNLDNMYNNMQFIDSDLIDYYVYQIKAEEVKHNYLKKKEKKRKLKILK